MAAPSGQGTIRTIAGTGTPGGGGDGGSALAAQFRAPRDSSYGPDGSLYVADYDNNRIRRISPAGIITTVAGTGVGGYSGDNGPATSARLQGPHDVIVDDAGNVYIADSANHRIRMVDTSGIIRTIAGTGVAGYNGDGIRATNARLQNPKSVALRNGELYISDGGNNRIRKVDGSGIITTVAGTGVAGYGGDGGPAVNARLNANQRIAFDPLGNLLIADRLNNRIRRVDLNGMIRTIAGTGVAGYNGDGIPATSARLYYPRGVVVDDEGNVFIADSGNNRVRVVYPSSGLIATIAGTGSPGFSGDAGAAASARLTDPRGVNIRDDGDLVIADTGNNRIRLVDFVDASDTTAPSVPGKPSGVSNTSTTINVSWGASDDDVATSITYRVYRDGGTNAVGTVTSSSTTTVSFTDTSLAPGSTHTYEVTASDGQNTSARSPASDPITVQSGPAAIFADGFAQGFANWTGVAGMTVDNATGNPSAPSARAQASGAPAWAWRTLGATYPSACLSTRINLASIGSTVDLFRLRTATDGPIARAYVATNRVLWIRADSSGATLASSTVLPLGSWNTVELCTTVGTSGSATLYLNGTQIAGPWTANTGTTPIGRIQIGDNAAKTFTANFDDVVLDQTAG